MDHTAYINAAAEQLGLRIPTEARPGVAVYFALAASMAELVQGLPLGPADEPGHAFNPVSPQVGE